MDHAKYIIIKGGGLELPVVFSPLLKHSDVAKGFVIAAAGFCDISNNEVACWGKSVSLDIESRPVEDAYLIRRQILGLDS